LIISNYQFIDALTWVGIMNFRDLEYLVAVAKYQHFGKASDACFVSQPALSMQLKKLEDELGVMLFERTNRQVLITEMGQYIVDRAQEILKQKRALIDYAKMTNNPLGGRMRFGAFPTLAPYLFPLIMFKLHKQLPDLEFELIEEKTNVLVEKLLSGEIDVALLALPVLDEHFQATHLFDDPFYLAVPANHPLSQYQKVTQRQLANETILLLEEGHCLRAQALELCQKNKMEENTQYRAASLEMLRQMVIAGQGITLIPEIAVIKNRHIHHLNFSTPVPYRKIAFVTRKSNSRTACFEIMIDCIRETMQQQVKSK
jgi:LysR family transcriptional regulator, hydrogen peroxide-inducible genes activator